MINLQEILHNKSRIYLDPYLSTLSQLLSFQCICFGNLTNYYKNDLYFCSDFSNNLNVIKSNIYEIYLDSFRTTCTQKSYQLK